MKRSATLIAVGVLITAVVTISTAASSAKAAAGPTKESALEAEKELGDAMRTNDPDGLCRLLDPDWTVVNGFADTGDTRDGVCAAVKAGNFTRNTYVVDLANARVRIYGNIATVTFGLSAAGPAAKYASQHKAWSAKEVQTDVLKWEDGGWKCVLTHETIVKGTLVIEGRAQS